jgi:hypothetical protein
MRKPRILLLTVLCFLLIGYFATAIVDKRFFKKAVLSESTDVVVEDPTPTPTLTPIPTSTPTPTASPTPKPKNTPTPSPVPQPKISQAEIHALMERFAGQYAVDVNILRHIAVCESGFDPGAVNGPYAGLYQFNSTTWKKNRILMGEDTNPDLRFNAEESIQTTAYLISQGKRYLWPNCYP